MASKKISKKKLMIVAAVAAAVLIFILVLLLYINSELRSLTPVVNINGPIAIYGAVGKTGVATYNMSQYLVPYALLNFNLRNVTSANMSMTIYDRDPIFTIYLLNTSQTCYHCLNYASLYGALYKKLEGYGLIRNATSFQNVTLNNISTVKSNSLIIVSTGIFPASLLPNSGLPPPVGIPNITINNLLSKGDYILYVGTNFSRMMQGSQIYSTQPATIMALNEDNLYTFPYSGHLNSSLYFNNPSFGFANGHNYGAFIYANASNGTFMAFTGYPSTIWPNVATAANDISSIIVSRLWITPLASGTFKINGTSGNLTSNTTLLTTNLLLKDTALAPNTINKSYSLIRVNASNEELQQDAEFPASITYRANGTLGVPSIIGYGNQEPMNIRVNTLTSNQSFSVYVYNRSLDFAYSFPISFFNTVLPANKYYAFGNLSATGEYYIATLVDINDRHYSDALFYVPNLNVTPINVTYGNFNNRTFSFTIMSDGEPLSNVYYNATINGAYEKFGTVENGVINYVLPAGAVVNYGLQYITIHIKNRNYIKGEFYAQPPGIPTTYIEFGVAGAIILFLNLVLRAPNREEYYIDVPEMKYAEKIDVVVAPGQIINLFDSINHHYQWKYMPLTTEEIKSGIGENIRLGNSPISITMQNTNEVLYKLTDEGLLKSVDDYYIPQSWEPTSKHDVEYLVIFRKLRDYFVEKAALFTDLDKSDDADMVVTQGSRQMYVFIYSSISGIKKIDVMQGKKKFVVFISWEARQQFEDKLYDTQGPEAEMLRLALESNSIILTDTAHLDVLLA